MGRVLVVDDMLINRQATARLLQHHGHIAEMARNGADALAKLKKQPPDLIVLDQMMPEVDGLTFLTTIRRFPKYRDIPVIMLSGVTDRSCFNKAQSLGVKEFLAKGQFTGAQLLENIEKHLPKNEGSLQAAGAP